MLFLGIAVAASASITPPPAPAASLATDAAVPAFMSAPPPFQCGITACKDDNDCNDRSGMCTYCTGRVCNKSSIRCGTKPTPPPPGTKPFLMVGDSISIGIQPQLFQAIHSGENTTNCQHIPVNGGPASKGAACAQAWTGATIAWDVITFNFGLHSLDYPAASKNNVHAGPTLVPLEDAVEGSSQQCPLNRRCRVVFVCLVFFFSWSFFLSFPFCRAQLY